VEGCRRHSFCRAHGAIRAPLHLGHLDRDKAGVDWVYSFSSGRSDGKDTTQNYLMLSEVA